MNIIELYTMSSQELDKKDVLDKVLRRELSQVNAAALLGCTDRHIRRIIKKYKKNGVKAIISNRRGKPSNRAKSKELKDNVLGIVKDKYEDFGPTLAAEKGEEKQKRKIYHGTRRNG